MILRRYLPNTRESADATKRRVWREEGILVVNVECDPLDWEARHILQQVGAKLYGPRPTKKTIDR